MYSTLQGPFLPFHSMYIENTVIKDSQANKDERTHAILFNKWFTMSLFLQYFFLFVIFLIFFKF